jgi:hypothetical protein
MRYTGVVMDLREGTTGPNRIELRGAVIFYAPFVFERDYTVECTF